MNYNIERENNIIKNIAKEIVLECSVSGLKVSEELANYVVKLKLLDPRSGFTASEVMPRNLTQQLVMILVEELKKDTPAMNCIRLQVYWNTIKMNVGELKKEYLVHLTQKSEAYFNEIISVQDDIVKLVREMAMYILIAYNLGSVSQSIHARETAAAFQSVFKTKDSNEFFDMSEDDKAERVKILAKRVTGIRLFLKYIGKAGEGIDEVRDLSNKIEAYKGEIANYIQTVNNKINTIREVINFLAPPMYNITATVEGIPHQEIDNLPPECTMDDLKYIKAILVIMLQHSFYLSDIASKLEEIDGDSYFFLKEYDETLLKIQTTLRGRETVPTTEVYDDFDRLGEIWLEIQCYTYCFEKVRDIARKLEHINKREYFTQTPLEKALSVQLKASEREKLLSIDASKITVPSSTLVLKDSEDFHLEFNGFCAWTLFYNEGFLIVGNVESGIYQYEGQYYTFAAKAGHDMWARDPQYCLAEIYEYLRHNPEMVELLNAYDNLYNAKFSFKVVKVEKKIATRSDDVQTELHPIEENLNKDYTFSIWELKKRALYMSRLVKCTTKSSQTHGTHSHFRASIGLLAAPDKHKEVQTMKDSSCVHSAIANYLYGLRGHREDKFKVLELTRPIDESYQSLIWRDGKPQEGFPCEPRTQEEPEQWPSFPKPCPSISSERNTEKDIDERRRRMSLIIRVTWALQRWEFMVRRFSWMNSGQSIRGRSVSVNFPQDLSANSKTTEKPGEVEGH